MGFRRGGKQRRKYAYGKILIKEKYFYNNLHRFPKKYNIIIEERKGYVFSK